MAYGLIHGDARRSRQSINQRSLQGVDGNGEEVMTKEQTTPKNALIALQQDLKNVTKDASNPHFKSGYASLPAVMDYVKPILHRHNFVLVQETEFVDGVLVLKTTLRNCMMENTLTSHYPVIPAKPDPQGLGSALTYARRYSIMTILGLSAVEDDDDGNAAQYSLQAAKNDIAGSETLDELVATWKRINSHGMAKNQELLKAKDERKKELENA
jgi:hypothetical protein